MFLRRSRALVGKVCQNSGGIVVLKLWTREKSSKKLEPIRLEGSRVESCSLPKCADLRDPCDP